MINHYTVVGTSDVKFDETLNDYVFVKVIFYFVTKDNSSGVEKTVSTRYQLDLPNPHPENFIACKDVSRNVKKQWVDDTVKHIEENLIDVNLEKLAKM